MKKTLFWLGVVFLPQLAIAAAGDKLEGLATSAQTIVNTLVGVFFTLAVVYFFYGIGKYILAAGDPEKAKEGKSIMIYGSIAIAVMGSVFGIAVLLRETFGIDSNPTDITIPSFDTE